MQQASGAEVLGHSSSRKAVPHDSSAEALLQAQRESLLPTMSPQNELDDEETGTGGKQGDGGNRGKPTNGNTRRVQKVKVRAA